MNFSWFQNHWILFILTSSVIGFFGGWNSSWYDRPLLGWIRRPVILRTNKLSAMLNSTTASSTDLLRSSSSSNYKSSTWTTFRKFSKYMLAATQVLNLVSVNRTNSHRSVLFTLSWWKVGLNLVSKYFNIDTISYYPKSAHY